MNREIMRVGREQLAEVGAAALSLRAVARELGIVSSAIYRYVASRDELLTRLIDDAYNSLGDAVEADTAATADERAEARWVSAALTIRSWALDHPHEYSLLYGSPVPGYAAPEQTAVSGTRATRALVAIVADACRDRQLATRRSAPIDVGADLAADFATLRSAVDLDVDDTVVLDVLIAWSQLFGLVSFELFNQTRGVVTHHEALFETAARRLAGVIGLR
jgi:AcrR family transcriptional regulator